MAPSIEIDDEVFALLQSKAEPLVDSPNSVLRRLLGLAATNGDMVNANVIGEDTAVVEQKVRELRKRSRRRGTKRAQPGTILPDEEYEIPILQALDSHGGRAASSEVLDELGELLGDRLMPADHQNVSSRGTFGGATVGSSCASA